MYRLSEFDSKNIEFTAVWLVEEIFPSANSRYKNKFQKLHVTKVFKVSWSVLRKKNTKLNEITSYPSIEGLSPNEGLPRIQKLAPNLHRVHLRNIEISTQFRGSTSAIFMVKP